MSGHKCILSEYCRNPESCTSMTPHYIAMHGLNGAGGRTGASKVPEGYRYQTLKESPVRSNQKQIYDALDEYAATFERQFDEQSERIKSIYLWSKSPGTGKTTTAASLLNEYIVANYLGSLKRNRQALQRPAYFLDVNEFQTKYNLAAMTDDDAEMKKIKAEIRKCQTVPFLVMDDIGVRDATEAFRSYLHAIINYRCSNEMPTIFTSNLPMEDMKTVFDDRLYDRMRDQAASFHFGGESHRGRR